MLAVLQIETVYWRRSQDRSHFQDQPDIRAPRSWQSNSETGLLPVKAPCNTGVEDLQHGASDNSKRCHERQHPFLQSDGRRMAR